MKGIHTILMHLPVVGNRITSHGGFLTSPDIKALAEEENTRLLQVLVRCGSSRFICAVCDAEHLTGIIQASGKDYVRDVSLPADG